MMKEIIQFSFIGTFWMVFVIWIVQIYRYPSFSRLRSDRFSDFHKAYMKQITVVVFPAMIFELVGTFICLIFNPFLFPIFLNIFSLILVIAIWVSTFLIQVPLHKKLLIAYDIATQKALVKSNWIRTILWSMRGILCFYLMQAFKVF